MSENIASQQQGGIAAETIIINPNPNLGGNPQPPAEFEVCVTLKHAAEEYNCAVSSLKSNIRAERLPAIQENPRAAYMVRLSDVERFLRAAPTIVSTFHPKPGGIRGEKTSDAPPLADIAQHSREAAASRTDSVGSHAASLGVSAPQVESTPFTQTSKQKAIGPDSPVNPGKRRRRRRGKGGLCSQPGPIGVQPLVLKNLVGASPQERLRVVAVLNELAGIVASA